MITSHQLGVFGTLLVGLLLSGCSSAERLTSLPAGLNLQGVPRQTIEMTARDYEFDPDAVKVKAGTILELKIKSIDGTHGFRLGEFDIDTTLEEGVEKTIEVYLPKSGEYGFRCSHFCGLGHFGMKGKIIVE